jgi:hydroxyacylglutathione hydrolase
MRIHRIFGVMACTYLIETPEALFLVDAGFMGHGRTILRKIRALGRSPEELRLAIITHGHLDHFGGLAEICERTPALAAAHPAHADFVAHGGKMVSPGRSAWGRSYARIARSVMPRLAVPDAGPVLPLADGQWLDGFGLNGRVLHTPGHSEGCLSVLLDDGTALTGDLIQGKRLPTFAPELPTMAQDPESAHASWCKLLDAGAKQFLPAHAKPFSADELIATMRRDGVRLPIAYCAP